MSTLDDAAEVPGAAHTPGNSSSGEPPSAAATPVSESVYEGADKIVPSTAPTVVKIEGHTEDVDRWPAAIACARKAGGWWSAVCGQISSTMR